MRLNRRTFLAQLGYSTAGLGLLYSIPHCLAQSGPGKALPRSTPEAQGVSSQAILNFLEALSKSQHEFHSIIMVRHGHIIAEGWWAPYRADLNHMLYSMSKSFTSTAAGFAVSEGKLSVDAPVISFFPDELPDPVSPNLAALKVKDLLSMAVGRAQDSTWPMTKETNWVKAFLAMPIEYQPGTKFLYDSGATYMVSAIVQKVTGQKVIDYLKPRLFAPLGIEGMTWEVCPRGINTGGWGLNIQTEGLARFGQLLLQKGQWNGKTIVPAKWIQEATTAKIHPAPSPDSDRLTQSSDWHQGYCYQFWRSRHNAFRGDGAFGQYTIVMPDQDAVIAITSETQDMQGELNLVWEHLLPAMEAQPLVANAHLESKLRKEMASLTLLPPKAHRASSMAGKVSGKTIKFENNPQGLQSISLNFQNDTCRFVLTNDKGTYPITCGVEKWVLGETSLPGIPLLISAGLLENHPQNKVAASGTWKNDSTFEMILRFYETPHHLLVSCHFEGEQVTLTVISSLSHKEYFPALQGKLTV